MFVQPTTRRLILGLLIVAGASVPAVGQDDDEDEFAAGLIGRYSAADGTSLQRIDRDLRFDWGNNSPDRRLAPGPFRVEWNGRLMSQLPGEYHFYVFAAGRYRITLGEKVVLAGESSQPAWKASSALELPFDYHRLQIQYERTGNQGRFALFWSGPQFWLEPIDGRQFYHDRSERVAATFERGAELVRALRCAACHELPGELPALPAPALDRTRGNLHSAWMVDWLTARPTEPTDGFRRMPHFALNAPDARAIAAFLTADSLAPLPKQPDEPKAVRPEKNSREKKNKKKADEVDEPPKSPLEQGRELLLTVGCLACHQLQGVGTQGPFDGGDLTEIASKRPADFFERWLADPRSCNQDHRMPLIELTSQERQRLAIYLQTLGRPPESEKSLANLPAGEVERGRQLFTDFRCASCHRGPASIAAQVRPERSAIGPRSNWHKACFSASSGQGRGERQPQYELTDDDQQAVREFVARLHPRSVPHVTSDRIVVERNCLACHLRDDRPGLAPELTKLAERFPELAALVPAMTPPPLTSVGDKLHDEALREAIRRQGPSHRPYLAVRMPRFSLTGEELRSLVDGLIAADRIPLPVPEEMTPAVPGREQLPDSATDLVLDAAGSRLVTPDGFGCTSCHQIGSVLPVKAPLNARGPDLSMMGKTIRRSWYERWVRNPARIVPRMEMPSVQVAVHGVLDNDLDVQLAAVWEVLNRPGFQPPAPNPVRTVRHTGDDAPSRAVVISDVVRSPAATYVKPLLIGLSNRHNILFDLETAKLAEWSIGDVARQRTEGKSWYWESAGQAIVTNQALASDLVLLTKTGSAEPLIVGQFPTELDELSHDGASVVFRHRLQFPGANGSRPLRVVKTERLTPLVIRQGNAASTGFRRVVELTCDAPADFALRVLGTNEKQAAGVNDRKDELSLAKSGSGPDVQVRAVAPQGAVFEPEGMLTGQIAQAGSSIRWELEYRTMLPVDRFPLAQVPPQPGTPTRLHVVPGFTAMRLPLSDEIMPTALAWRPDGTLAIASLKGQVWLARDSDRDGWPEQLVPFSDDLAAPYGLHATADYIDVINKYALLRLIDEDSDGRADRTVTLASGWGHTTDYHDWVVGLPHDERGNYYVAIPCQQDQRSKAAARYHGEFLRLVPREPTADDPSRFAIEPISRGHRFPMGIARDRSGNFFVTDNQGNYNPFNELNHVRPGAHFGFINALERPNNPHPPLTPPAINIPHPWTRSVNGICFLNTPETALGRDGELAFGPWEGHLIGCEYDTRRLIRMTLQSVGETFQGAAYPFSYDTPREGPPLMGPITCAVSPQGELFVGGIRDSGWGGANNIGEVVQLRFDPESQPNGIAEVRATSRGFTVDFLRPVQRDRAGDLKNYSLSSYTRISTPAYGGEDVDRKVEKIRRVILSDDGRRATLELNDLRAGRVYELHVRSLADSQEFFPAEAHYTLNVIPEERG